MISSAVPRSSHEHYFRGAPNSAYSTGQDEARAPSSDTAALAEERSQQPTFARSLWCAGCFWAGLCFPEVPTTQKPGCLCWEPPRPFHHCSGAFHSCWLSNSFPSVSRTLPFQTIKPTYIQTLKCPCCCRKQNDTTCIELSPFAQQPPFHSCAKRKMQFCLHWLLLILRIKSLISLLINLPKN